MKGSILLETLWGIGLLIALWTGYRVTMVLFRQEAHRIESQRLRYDGLGHR